MHGKDVLLAAIGGGFVCVDGIVEGGAGGGELVLEVLPAKIHHYYLGI